MSETHVEVPVLIVGAGPAGLASSLALARYGVEHILIERYAGTSHSPRAHIVNQRTVEILRHLGVQDRFEAVATPQEYMRNNMWVTSLAGEEILRSEAWGTSERVASEYRTSSPCQMANCPQIVLEPMLVDAAIDAGGDIRFRHELVSLEQDDNGVTSIVRVLDTGDTLIVRSQYVIGADGARSSVMDAAGLTVEGPAGLAHAASVWFEADLTEYLEHRPGVLIWNVMPGQTPPLRLGTLICYKPHTEFSLALMYDPDVEDIKSWSDADAIARVRAAVGVDDIEVTVRGISAWQLNAQVAPVYSAGRVHCMGDAVHRHPPYNGLGLNMSIADAYNLAWKLTLVIRGTAGPALLNTYSDERRPVGAAGVERSIASVGDMAAVDAALGLEPDQSEEDGWAALAGIDAPGPEGVERRRAIRDAVKLIDYQQNAHGLELGYIYLSDAVIDDGTPAPDPAPDAHLHYVPTTRPGARVPHARLEFDGRAISSLDLVDDAGFALLTGVGGEPWVQAAADITARTGVSIAVHRIGRRTGGPSDPYGEWEQLSEVQLDGCVLVRPDRHVAWRYDSFDSAAADALDTAVAQVLARGDNDARPDNAAHAAVKESV